MYFCCRWRAKPIMWSTTSLRKRSPECTGVRPQLLPHNEEEFLERTLASWRVQTRPPEDRLRRQRLDRQVPTVPVLAGLWGYLRWVHDKARLNLCPSRATLAEVESRGFSDLRALDPWGRRRPLLPGQGFAGMAQSPDGAAIPRAPLPLPCGQTSLRA